MNIGDLVIDEDEFLDNSFEGVDLGSLVPHPAKRSRKTQALKAAAFGSVGCDETLDLIVYDAGLQRPPTAKCLPACNKTTWSTTPNL